MNDFNKIQKYNFNKIQKYRKNRKFCFTIPQANYPHENFDKIMVNNSDRIKYLLVGWENGKKTSYAHYQCYIQLNEQIRRQGFWKMVGFKCHMENQRGTNEEARNYCWKGQFEEKGTEFPQPSAITQEYGRFCKGQGERSEMLDIKEFLDEGLTHYAIVNKDVKYFSSYGRYHSFYEKFKNWADDERLNVTRQPLDVRCIHGANWGTGKTTAIYTKWGEKNVYRLKDPNGDNKNWNGYRGQKVLLIDDFYSWIKLTDMLNILDNKPYRVRQLNGYRWAEWTHVYITSNQSPRQWYPKIRNSYDDDKRDVLEAFYSRIKKCLKVTKGNTGTLVIKEYSLCKSQRENQTEYLSLEKVGW